MPRFIEGQDRQQVTLRAECLGLSDLRLRRFYAADHIDRVRRQHMTKHASYFGRAIWQMMVLQD